MAGIDSERTGEDVPLRDDVRPAGALVPIGRPGGRRGGPPRGAVNACHVRERDAAAGEGGAER